MGYKPVRPGKVAGRRMQSYDVVIAGGGPAGLSAAIEVAKHGGRPLLIDENIRPGGQLFKQIHKFFGSEEHHAGTRGFQIGEELLAEAKALGVEILLESRVFGISRNGEAAVTRRGESFLVKGKMFILATGACENAISFPGCSLPGVMTAGAAQTFANLYGTIPGRKILMVGSGNVGLIVSYQLMQAGAEVAMIIDAARKVAGYQVHMNKVRRVGVPVKLGYHIKEVVGTDHVEKVILEQVDEKFRPIPGTEEEVEADTVCLAVGLNPRVELAELLKCEMCWSGPLGGCLPSHNEYMETTVDNVLIAGDLSGIEEASTALEEGRQAGITASYKLGLIDKESFLKETKIVAKSLDKLRSGAFGERRLKAKEAIWESWGEANER